MTEVELAKLMRKSNYTCQGIDCKECIIVNRYKTCLMEDVQIYCDDILGADDNYLETLEKENAKLKAFSKKLIETNNKLRNSLRKYEVVPDVDYLPNGIEIYKENVDNNPYSKE